jgi:hypothetical protein
VLCSYRNTLDFYIISRSSLGFSANFQLARSSTRLNSCTSSQSSPNYSSAIRTALAWSINKAHTRSCSILRYPTLDATTSKYIVSNRCSRNCSTPNLKIASGKGGSLHCIFLCDFGVAHPGGAELGPMALVLGMGKIRLPDAGASVMPALKREQKWLTNAGASIAMAFEERRRWKGQKLAPWRWRIRLFRIGLLIVGTY